MSLQLEAVNNINVGLIQIIAIMPAYVTLNAKVEQVQRCASRWILRMYKDQSSYKEQLTLLDLLPLSLDHELKDLIFFINAFTVVPI